MKSSEGFVRMRTLQGVVLFIFLLIAGRLAYIQLVDSKYNELAKANVLRHVVHAARARCSTATANTWFRAASATT